MTKINDEKLLEKTIGFCKDLSEEKAIKNINLVIQRYRGHILLTEV